MDRSLFQKDKMVGLLDGVRDPNRIEIIFLLANSNPMNVGDIAARFPISRPAISHHLKILKDAGIVKSEKIGQEVFYRLDRKVIVSGLREFADALEKCCTESSSE